MAIPAVAQSSACNLGMTLNCSNGTCTATTVNNGSNSCTGTYLVGMELIGQSGGSVGGLQNSLNLSDCFTFPSPAVPTIQTPVSLCFGDSSLPPGGSFTMSAGVNPGAGGSLSNVVAITIVLDPNSGDELAQVYVFNNGGPTPSCT